MNFGDRRERLAADAPSCVFKKAAVASPQISDTYGDLIQGADDWEVAKLNEFDALPRAARDEALAAPLG